MISDIIRDINNTVERVHEIVVQIMPSSGRTVPQCKKKLDSCPPGHELKRCQNEDGFYCKQCAQITFQPNENRYGDKCRLRRVCVRPFMEYNDYGNTIKDADCRCKRGYHFENEDQRACVPNMVCDKGYGQGPYVCENCLQKNMYSDMKDRFQKCIPLTNCEKDNRCTKKKSNGTFDNVCGPKVRDINDCSSIVAKVDDNSQTKAFAIAGGVIGALVLVILLILLFVVIRRRRARQKYLDRPLSQEQLEELKNKILEKCEKDELLCKKALAESFSVIENRIDRQVWTLAQELFRTHIQAGKYEVVVAKYKDCSPKEAVRGYLGEWKTWRGDTYAAVSDLFQSLRHSKRDDIIYEICNRLRHDVGDIALNSDGNVVNGSANNRAQNSFFYDVVDMFPCLKKPEKPKMAKEESAETTNKLLESQSRDVEVEARYGREPYPGRSHPSAPSFEENSELFNDPEVHFHRQYSQPIQATS